MIRWIILISAVAIVFYVGVPVLYAYLIRNRNNTVLARLRSLSCFNGTVLSLSHNTMSIQPDVTDSDTEEEERISVQIRKTHLYTLSLNNQLARLRWRELIAIKKGGTVVTYLPDSANRSTICVFHEERNLKAFEARIKKAVPVMENQIKPYSIALGVFLEFMIFLHALHYPELTKIALLALIAIFGKALPYCPPGLLLTWLGNRITISPEKTTKKSRQWGTVGILVYTAGILLNIATLIFIISNVRLGGYIL